MNAPLVDSEVHRNPADERKELLVARDADSDAPGRFPSWWHQRPFVHHHVDIDHNPRREIEGRNRGTLPGEKLFCILEPEHRLVVFHVMLRQEIKQLVHLG